MANNLDLGQIYGLNCPPGGCIGTTASINPNIPTLEQIASYNIANPRVPGTSEFVPVSELPNVFQSRNADVNAPNSPMLNTVPSNQMSIGQGMDQGMNQATGQNVNWPMQNNAQSSINQPSMQSQNAMMSNQPSWQNPISTQNQTTRMPTNGVTKSQNIPMTQSQIDQESPGMLAPIPNYNQPFPVTAESIQYLNGFLRTQIGRRIKVEFLIGGGSLIERDGYLLAVGANFILLNEAGTNDLLSCDFYNIKFVTFYY